MFLISGVEHTHEVYTDDLEVPSQFVVLDESRCLNQSLAGATA
jgi:hypothetical protein